MPSSPLASSRQRNAISYNACPTASVSIACATPLTRAMTRPRRKAVSVGSTSATASAASAPTSLRATRTPKAYPPRPENAAWPKLTRPFCKMRKPTLVASSASNSACARSDSAIFDGMTHGRAKPASIAAAPAATISRTGADTASPARADPILRDRGHAREPASPVGRQIRIATISRNGRMVAAHGR